MISEHQKCRVLVLVLLKINWIDDGSYDEEFVLNLRPACEAENAWRPCGCCFAIGVELAT